MLIYNFAIIVNENRVSKVQTREKAFGVEPPYGMLDYLSQSCRRISGVKQIIENLNKVLSGQQEQYGPWGHELAYLNSYKEKSAIIYEEYEDDKFIEKTAEVPTAWLLPLMEDWLKFLEKEEDGTEKILHGVWVPPPH